MSCMKKQYFLCFERNADKKNVRNFIFSPPKRGLHHFGSILMLNQKKTEHKISTWMRCIWRSWHVTFACICFVPVSLDADTSIRKWPSMWWARDDCMYSFSFGRLMRTFTRFDVEDRKKSSDWFMRVSIWWIPLKMAEYNVSKWIDMSAIEQFRTHHP